MASGGFTTGKNGIKSTRNAIRRILEKGFDWIALVLITLIILLTLVFF